MVCQFQLLWGSSLLSEQRPFQTVKQSTPIATTEVKFSLVLPLHGVILVLCTQHHGVTQFASDSVSKAALSNVLGVNSCECPSHTPFVSPFEITPTNALDVSSRAMPPPNAAQAPSHSVFDATRCLRRFAQSRTPISFTYTFG